MVANISIYQQGNWYRACISNFNLNISNVICQQQGFGRAISYTSTISSSVMNNTTKFGEIECSGYEMAVTQCRYQVAILSEGYCSLLNEVTVNCDTCKL